MTPHRPRPSGQLAGANPAVHAYARPFINGEIRHYLRDKGFPISIPGRWRELHARGRKLSQSGCPVEEVPTRLGISLERWAEIVRACAVRVLALPVEGLEPEP